MKWLLSTLQTTPWNTCSSSLTRPKAQQGGCWNSLCFTATSIQTILTLSGTSIFTECTADCCSSNGFLMCCGPDLVNDCHCSIKMFWWDSLSSGIYADALWQIKAFTICVLVIFFLTTKDSLTATACFRNLSKTLIMGSLNPFVTIPSLFRSLSSTVLGSVVKSEEGVWNYVFILTNVSCVSQPV